MARARSIKPGFFSNEDLIELPFEYRLLFAGLWTIADRAGRLEDRPKRIKLNVFPGDPVDIEAGLQALAKYNFIVRYEVAGTKYIQIVAWSKHQSPHVKEAASTIPAPGEYRADTGVAALTPSSLTPDSGLLTPDCVSHAQEPPGANGFDHVKAAYPTFAGRQDWLTAEHNAHQRVERDGVAWSDLVAAVERYRVYCDSGGVSGPQFVMTPAKFFGGADKPWAQEWKPPPNKAQVKQDKNISVAQRWLDRQNDASQ
jgi:hypothetical protein